jgi:sulfur relay (sulfurtransferase) complex TusBCD TusD component (DsrE family)
MKIAYVFATPSAAAYKLGTMILPQMEAGHHGVDVVGMFFFDDNTFMLRAGDPLGERVGELARAKGMLLMLCDQCAHARGLADKTDAGYAARNVVEGVQVGCFPDLYKALAGNPPDQVITL